MATDGPRIVQRFRKAKERWDRWASLYDEAFSFTQPNANPFDQEHRMEGARKNQHVYDTTAVTASRQLISKLHSNLVPPSQQWFELEASEQIQDPTQRKTLNELLQNQTQILWRIINESNFDLAINEFFGDLIIGTGALLVLENDDDDVPVKFKSVAPNIIYPEANALGQIDTVWRDFTDIRPEDLQLIWPRAEIPDRVKTESQNNPDKTFDFIEGVIWQQNKKNYRVVVLEKNTSAFALDVTEKTSPWVVARWSKASGEVGGRGPAIEALPTIRSTNQLMKYLLQSSALSVAPPYMAFSDGVFNPYMFEIEPNKVIPISRQSAGSGKAPLQKLDTNAQLQFGQAEMNDLRQQIKEILFANPTRPVDAPEQTATEVMIRQRQFLEEIGPAFGRLEVELLPKIINRVIDVLKKKGVLPNALKVDNKSISVRFKSPLIRGAELQKVENFQNMLSIMQQTFGQQMAFAGFNVESIPEYLSEKLDVDAELVKGPQEVAQMIQQLMQSQQQQEPQAPSSQQEAQQQFNQEQTQGQNEA